MKEEIKNLLLKVDKPARYCGGEYNTPVIKENMPLNFCMCFPDVYEVAMSNLGIKILYHMLNSRVDTACETCYAVWNDFATLLQEKDMPLFSTETQTPINQFDILGFSMQYEMSYTNVLYMLELGKIPLFSADRAESDPIVVAGGPCVVNPMPLVPFFDAFSIGDGEEALNSLAACFVENKSRGGSKKDFLLAASKIEGIYVPSIKQEHISRAVVDNLDKAYYPTKIQVPNIEAVHNRAVLEVFRGCTRGCRFCQAGMIYRPVRERNVETLTRYAEELIINNGFDELSLSSLSTCDYPFLRGLLENIKPLADKHKVSLALPSTRLDSFEADFVDSSRKSSLTFAPEAGTQRLRDVINKNITEEDIFGSLIKAFSKGYFSVKLYFMIGLPTECEEDIKGIVSIASRIKKLYKENSDSRKPLSLSISTSTFVPKPFTPFQWARQISLEEIKKAQDYLRENLRKMGVKYNWHDGYTSVIEACLARGDEKMAEVIHSAYKNGCVFDSWNEFFDFSKWEDAFTENNVKMSDYTEGFDTNSTLSWERIDMGVSKEFLLSELEKSLSAKTTPDCRQGCHGCGINKTYPSAFKEACNKGK